MPHAWSYGKGGAPALLPLALHGLHSFSGMYPDSLHLHMWAGDAVSDIMPLSQDAIFKEMAPKLHVLSCGSVFDILTFQWKCFNDAEFKPSMNCAVTSNPGS